MWCFYASLLLCTIYFPFVNETCTLIWTICHHGPYMSLLPSALLYCSPYATSSKQSLPVSHVLFADDGTKDSSVSHIIPCAAVCVREKRHPIIKLSMSLYDDMFMSGSLDIQDSPTYIRDREGTRAYYPPDSAGWSCSLTEQNVSAKGFYVLGS